MNLLISVFNFIVSFVLLVILSLININKYCIVLFVILITVFLNTLLLEKKIYKGFKYIGISFLLSSIIILLIDSFNIYSIIYMILGLCLIGLNIMIWFYKNKKELFNEIFKFCIVGFICFLIDYSLLYILTEYVGIYELLSALISFIISCLISYFLSCKYVFNSNKKDGKTIIIFFITSFIGLLINELVMYIGIKFNIYYMISKLVATIIVMFYNFITKKIILKRK